MSLTVAPGNPTVNTKWRLDVNTAYDGTSTDSPTWKQLRGMNSFAPTVPPTVQDASDYDTEAWGADAVTQRKWQNTLTVLRKVYSDAYDPGQEALRSAADSLDTVHVRWYERGISGGEAYEGLALVQWEPQGGDPTGLSSVNVTLLGQGARSAITTPVDAPAWQASHAYSLDDQVTGDGHIYKVTTAGTSGSSEPTWPGSGTVTDGDVTWTFVS